MSISPVPRNVASATYGFVRFIGGGLAPFAAGLLAEHLNAHVPFLIGAVAALAGAVLLRSVREALDASDADTGSPGPSRERADAEEAVRETPALEGEAVIAAEHGVGVEFVVATADPVLALTQVAEQVRDDAILVGASTQAAHRLFGSVAVRVVRTGRWTVTVVP